ATCKPATWCSSIRWADRTRTWASTWATAASSMRRPPEARSASTHWTTPITGAISSRWEPCSPDEKTGAGQWPEPVSPRPVPDGPGIRTRASRMQRQSGLAGACRLLRCTHLRQFLALFGREHGADLRTGLRTQQGHLCLRLAQRVGSLPGLGLVEGVGTAQFAQRFVRGTQRLSLVIEGLRLVVTD